MPVTDTREFVIRRLIPPDVRITRLDYPSSASPGETVVITVEVTNQGGDTAIPQWVRLVDLDTGEELKRKDFVLPTGGSTGASWSLIMPDRDWRLRVEAGYESTVTAARTLTVGLTAPPVPWPTVLVAGAPVLLGLVAVVASELTKKP